MGVPERPRKLLTGPRRRLGRALREATSALRLEPSVLLIGTQKGGTTSLYRYLVAHPNVRPPAKKEIGYFANRFARGHRWYRSRFPLRSPFESSVTVDATTTYLFHPAVPARVAAELPKVRIIALLRDPVERAYSHYKHSVRAGREPLPFEEALDREPERLMECWSKIGDPGWKLPPSFAFHTYLSRGRYWEQLERWFKHVERGRVLILRSEDLFDEPRVVYGQVLRFLQLPSCEDPPFERHNAAKPWPDMAAGTHERLLRYYDPLNQELYRQLGRDFGWSRPPTDRGRSTWHSARPSRSDA